MINLKYKRNEKRGQRLRYPHKITIKNNDLGINTIGWTREVFFDLVLRIFGVRIFGVRVKIELKDGV